MSWRKFTTLVEIGFGGLALLALAAYAYVAGARAAYPFSLEWLEANSFVQVVRVLEGRPLYARPAFDFIPLLYTPLYYYLSAAVSLLTGQIMLAMRLVSIAASGLCFGAIYAICRTRRHPPLVALLGAGLFAATYGVTGYWLDIAKMDSLFLGLLLAAYALTMTRAGDEAAIGALAGLVAFLAFSAKQQALVALPFLVLHLLVERRWHKALWLGGTLGLATLAFVASMERATGGWFSFYVYTVPSAHPVFRDILLNTFWTTNLWPDYAWLVLAIGLATLFVMSNPRLAQLYGPGLLAISLFLPLCLMSAISMAHQWGWINNMLPLAAALAVMGAEAYQQVAAATQAPGPIWRRGAYILASALLLAQFAALRYDPRQQIPRQETIAAGKEILALLRSSAEPIFIPTSPHLLYMVGRQPHFQASSLGDISLAAQRDPAIGRVVQADLDRIAAYIGGHELRTVILPNAPWYNQVFTAEQGYSCESLVADRPPLISVTGVTSYLDRVCRLQPRVTR